MLGHLLSNPSYCGRYTNAAGLECTSNSLSVKMVAAMFLAFLMPKIMSTEYIYKIYYAGRMSLSSRCIRRLEDRYLIPIWNVTNYMRLKLFLI